MDKLLDIETFLAPISEDQPAGEDLRYDPVYDAIKEARRADDLLDRGDWQRELKTADWNEVVKLSTAALQERTKDLQIAVWLTEGLVYTSGFPGLAAGLEILCGLLENFWETLHPPIEDDDLDYRVGPLSFLNDKLWLAIKGVPLTDPQSTEGYSLLRREESRVVGYEKDNLNQYGDVDDRKRDRRNELLQEGKLAPEDFDAAVERSSKEFYRQLVAATKASQEVLSRFDDLIDNYFGIEGPSLAEISSAINDCASCVTKIFEDKLAQEPDPISDVEPVSDDTAEEESIGELADADDVEEVSSPSSESLGTGGLDSYNKDFFAQSEGREKALWDHACKKLMAGDVKVALEQLFIASCTSASVREKNRYRLLIAKLCLKADRADLARPILEELFSMIDDLQLEKWESPVWIAELIEALYKCLMSERYIEEDPHRAAELLTRLCRIDITKAMIYRN